MYDKKQALGFILIIMVVMTYTQFVFAPYQPPAQSPQNNATQGQSTSPSNPALITSAATQTNNQSASSTPSSSGIRIPSLIELQQAPKSTIKTGAATIEISHLGARLISLKLENIKKELKSDEHYNLINPLEGMSLPGGLSQGLASDEGLLFQVSNLQGFEKIAPESYQVPAGVNASITFLATTANAQTFVKTFKFKAGSYLFGIEANVTPSSPSEALTLAWPIHVDEATLSERLDPYFFSILSDTNKAEHVVVGSSSVAELATLQNAQWISFGDRYFSSTLIPSTKKQNVRVEASKDSFTLYARGDQSNIGLDVFAGPKDYGLLTSLGLQLERSIDLGFFSFVAYPLLQLLKFFFSIFGNYGVAIVALTLLVKTVFYPLNKASLNSMRAMQELSPEIAALRERIKDATQLNQEMLALYKRKGVNPMGGCLPVLIQIPVFFGLYSALQNAVELRHAPFALWVNDLATPERLEFFGINLPFMVLAMGAIMFVQQYRTPMPNMDPTQRKVMLGMSLMFTFMFLIYPFPAGLALYMLINTTISLVQQQCIRSETMNKPFQITLLASAAILAVAFIFSKV